MTSLPAAASHRYLVESTPIRATLTLLLASTAALPAKPETGGGTMPLAVTSSHQLMVGYLPPISNPRRDLDLRVDQGKFHVREKGVVVVLLTIAAPVV